MSKPLATNEPLTEVGEVLRRARRSADLPLDRLAAITGIGRSTICRIERGLMPRVAAADVFTLAAALQVDARRLSAPFSITHEPAAAAS